MRTTRTVIAAAVFAAAGALGAAAPVLAAGKTTSQPQPFPYVIQCTSEVTVNGDIQTSSAIATRSVDADAPEGCSAYQL